MEQVSDDELWSELDDAGDLRRGEILLELADRCYHRNDLAQFESLVEAAAQAAERAGDDRLSAYARFNQAQGLMELERPAEAIAHFLAAAGCFGLIGEQSDIALSHQRAGDAAALAGDATSALTHWRTALAIYEAESDPLASGRVHMAIGGELMVGEQSAAAVDEFRAARAAFRTARSAHHVSWADDATAEALIHEGHADQAVRAAQQARLSGTVTVGLAPTTSGVLGLPLMQAMRTRYPDVRLHMVESMSGHLTAMLHARELDLAVLFDTRLHQAQQATGARRWDMAPLLEEDLFLICARDRGEGPGHPRGRQLPETITVADLVQEPLILPTGPHGLRSTLDTAFARDRVAPHVELEVDSLAMVMAAVDAGLGSTVQPWAAMGR